MASSPSIGTNITQALDHQTHALLSALDKRLQARDNKWDFRITALESRVTDSERVTFLPTAAAEEKTLDASFVHEEVHDHFSGKASVVLLEGIDGARRSKIRARKVRGVCALESPAVGFAQHRDGCSSALRADVEAHLSAAALQSIGARAAALQSALHVVDARRPRVESSVEALPVFEDRGITEQLAGARGRLDNPTTTLLGPNINLDGAVAGGATGRTVRAVAVGWSQVLVQNGARKLFDEMPTSAWRSPSRVLEVTIHQARYPMTQSVIRAVFAQYGKVERIHVFGGLDPVLTHVVFETKHEVADAFGELHGRNIYDGCCQLDIQWCSSQDPRNTNLAFSYGDNMVTIAAAKPATSVIGQDVFPNTNNSIEVANISLSRDAIKEREFELALLENEHLCADKRADSSKATTEPENLANDSNLTEVAESVEGDAASGEQGATDSSQTNGHNYVALSVDSCVVTSESKAHSFETEGEQIDQQQKEAQKTEADVLEGVLKPAERNCAGSVEELIGEEVDADGHASVGGTADASGKQEAKPMQVKGEATSCILEFKEVDKDSEEGLCDDCTVAVLAMEDSELQYAGISQIPVMPSDGLPQVLGETEPSQSTNEGNNDPYTSQLTILEEHYAVLEEGNIKYILEQVHVPEITGRSGGKFHQRSASAADPPTIELVLENAHQGASEDAEQKDNCGNSMSNERQRHSFLQVRLDVLQHEYSKVDPSHAFAMSVVRSLVREHEYWRFWICPLCDRKKFVDTGLLLSHMCTRQPRAVLPRLEYSKLDYWLFHFVWLLLKFLADQGAELCRVMVWDPGGIDAMYRLEGKPNFKEGM